MITLKIEPVEFKTGSGDTAIVSGLVPQKNGFMLAGEVQTVNNKIEMLWWASGEAVDKDCRRHNLVDEGDGALDEFVNFSNMFSPG